MYDTSMSVLLFEVTLLTLSIGVGLNFPLLLTLYVVRWVGLVLMFLKGLTLLYKSFEMALLTIFMGVGLK